MVNSNDMQTVAVLTGDIIQSRKLQNGDLKVVLNSIRSCFKKIEEKVLKKEGRFEFYRGDSFQILLKEPELALKVAFILRARLRSLFMENSRTKGTTDVKSDARISIGIGTIRMDNSRNSESQGEAFEYSGLELDRMEKESLELSVKTPWNNFNEEFKVNCMFADNTINNWSAKTAESVFRYLLHGDTQEKLAKHFKISQPAIRKRLITQGNMKAMDAFIQRYQDIILQPTQTTKHGL